MKYAVKFQLERRSKKINGIQQVNTKNIPVLLSITWNYNQIKVYTGKRCNETQWNPITQRLKGNIVTASNGESRFTFNSGLDELQWITNDLFKSYDLLKISPTPLQVRTDLKSNLNKEEIEISRASEMTFFQYFKKYTDEAPVSFGRKKHLNTTYNKVLEYRPDTTFENLDAQYLSDFRKHLMKTLGRNTLCSELKRLRAFYGYANKMGWTTNYPFKAFTIDSESYGDPIFITLKERDQLYEADIEDSKLSHVRDIFILQCFIGCRVGDLTKLKHSNIIDGCIEYIAGKTKDNKPRVASVPLSHKALAIIGKYNLPNGDLVPYILDQKYNLYLKELFKNQKINRMVTIIDPKSRTSVQKSIADIVSSHMARRVFIGGLHHAGVKNEIIASMSGHVENSRAFSRYYKIEKSDQQAAISLIE